MPTTLPRFQFTGLQQIQPVQGSSCTSHLHPNWITRCLQHYVLLKSMMSSAPPLKRLKQTCLNFSMCSLPLWRHDMMLPADSNIASRTSVAGCQLTAWSWTQTRQNYSGLGIASVRLLLEILANHFSSESTPLPPAAMFEFSAKHLRLTWVWRSTCPAFAQRASTGYSNSDGSDIHSTLSLSWHLYMRSSRHGWTTAMLF